MSKKNKHKRERSSEKVLKSFFKLDEKTETSIEDSKLIDFTKLFAIIVIEDGVVSDDENQYVIDFFRTNYPENITAYLFKKFQQYISEGITLEQTPILKNKVASYGEKVFVLMKIYELLFLNRESVRESELDLVRRIAVSMEILDNDRNLVESIYSGAVLKDDDLTGLKIKYIKIGGDAKNCDVYFHYKNLDIDVLKIEKFYCIINNNPAGKVRIKKFSIPLKSATKIQYGSDLTINKYPIDFEDLKLYFKTKYNPHPNKYYFLNKMTDEMLLSKTRSETSVAEVVLKGSLIRLIPLVEDVSIRVNGRAIRGSVFVNLNNMVQIDKSMLHIRKIIYREFFDKEFIHIVPGKEKYSLTNYGGDIYVSDKMERKWDASIFSKDGLFYIDTGSCYLQFWIVRGDAEKEINISGINKKLKKKGSYFELLQDDVIYVQGNIIRCDFENKVFEKTYFRFQSYVAKDLRYNFHDGSCAIHNMSFEADHGDLVGIMGPSGCGKSTLLNILNGNLKNKEGQIYLDNFQFKKYYNNIKTYISYVPQEDLLFENLTVYENLYYNQKLREPKFSKENVKERVNGVLKEIGLLHKRDIRVGSVIDKKLSGGERKRLNVGLELLADSYIYFLDEPTSGLSSKDSEKVIDILKRLALKGKIIFVVIHQPSSKIYKKFNKILLLDNGGKLAYFGNSYMALRYFNQHLNVKGSNEISCPSCSRVEPDLLLDSLEEPLRDLDGSVLPHRKFSPDYWEREYKKYYNNLRLINIPTPKLIPTVPIKKISRYNQIKQFLTLFERNFKNKLRDRSNLIITFLEAPILGGVIGFILRYAPGEEYSLYNNVHLSSYIFLLVIVSFFLSMNDSADEIIKDAAVLMREKMLNIRNIRYFVSKFLTLMIFTFVQNVLFLLVSFSILEVRELYFHYLLYMTAISFVGISMGLFFSTIPRLSIDAAHSIVPLALIPQIIFGGALIQYEDMNKSLTIYTNSPIPEICQIMPARWAYEGLMVMQDSYNSFHPYKDSLQTKLDNYIENRKDLIKRLGETEYKRRKYQLMNVEIVEHRRKYKKKYGNMKIHSAVTFGTEKCNEKIAELMEENSDMTREIALEKIVYPMFTREKKIGDHKINTAVYNVFFLISGSMLLNLLSITMLRKRENIEALFRKLSRKKVIR